MLATKKITFALLTSWSLLSGSCTEPAGRKLVSLGAPPTETAPDRSMLEIIALDEVTDAYALRYTPGRDSIRPRAVEVYLDHPGLTFLSAEAGPALEAAGKELVTQRKGASRLRLVAFSRASIAEVGDGVLAELHFQRKSDVPASLSILTERPILAPEGANTGLLVGEPLKL